MYVLFFKQKTAYEMRSSDWSSDVCSSDLDVEGNKDGDGDFGGQLESYVNVPISDTMAFRAMGYYRRDGGYVDNKPNNGTFTNGDSSTLSLGDEKIGRASCRERVCQ